MCVIYMCRIIIKWKGTYGQIESGLPATNAVLYRIASSLLNITRSAERTNIDRSWQRTICIFLQRFWLWMRQINIDGHCTLQTKPRCLQTTRVWFDIHKSQWIEVDRANRYFLFDRYSYLVYLSCWHEWSIDRHW